MAVTITQTANPAGVAADGSFNTTYTGLSTGVAGKGKLVVLCVGYEVVSQSVSAATIDDGVSGVRSMTSIAGSNFGNMGARMYRATVDDSSTTATFVLTYTGAIAATENHVAVYVLTDARVGGNGHPLSGTNTSTDMDVTAPLTTGSTTIATNGGMLAIAVGAADTVAKTWANLTADIDDDAGAFRFTTAFSTTAGTATRTCTGGTNGEDGVLVYAIFGPSSEPELNMMRYRPA